MEKNERTLYAGHGSFVYEARVEGCVLRKTFASEGLLNIFLKQPYIKRIESIKSEHRNANRRQALLANFAKEARAFV